MTISIDKKIMLELISEKHAEVLYNAVDANQKHLAEFLPWVGNMQSVENSLFYIKTCEMLYQQKKEVSFVILHDKTVVGRIGLHHLNPPNKSGSIGYWLIEKAQGQGIITQSCKKLISYGFAELGLNRIEIKAAVNNLKSRAIPEKMHFRKEGILKQAELVKDEFLDLVLYAMLKKDWTNKK